MKTGKQQLWKILVIVLLFALLLTFFRIKWIERFTDPEQPLIVNGQLDLRDWKFSEKRPITLSGDWEFLPDIHTNKFSSEDEKEEQYIEVPGDWSAHLNPESHSPYGYGTYRLKILVNPDEHQTYSMHVPSVRSASELYVNGLYSGKSGEVSTSEENFVARNVPYVSSSIRADESGIIEIALKAANFEDPRSSGLVRAIKFGDEEAVLAETKLSMTLQIVAGAVFGIHALFAFILYIIGVRDERLIYFAIAVFASAMSNLMGGDEKVLFDYITISYVGSFKLSFIMLLLFGWALVHCAKPQIQKITKLFLPIFTTLTIAVIITSIILPLEHLTFASIFSFSYVIFSTAVTTIVLVFSRKEFSRSVWLGLSTVALASHFGWWAYTLNTGIKMVHYPIDLIIAVICFSGVWFTHYNEIQRKTAAFATELQRADKVKDEFLANTSHELRNPLHSILNLSEALLERERSTIQDRSVKDLETVLAVGHRMSSMVTDLLDFVRLKEKQPTLNLQPCSLQAVTIGVIDMLRYMLEGKPVRLVNEVPNDLPFVLADEKRLIQIVFNLLHNAIKFTNSGEIKIKACMQGAKVEISVIDTGIGMDENTLETIFDPYTQENPEKEGGFGLGLNLSQKLVALHGSPLDVRSVKGEGTAFRFKLNLADTSEGTEVVQEQHLLLSSVKQKSEVAVDLVGGNSQPPLPAKKKSKILVVDDDPVNLQVIETILWEENYSLTTTLNGEEALDLLGEEEWDLVVSDVMMPQMSGYDLTMRIRERFSVTELPILLLTARSQATDIAHGFLVGANDYVTKPVDALEFKSRVRALTSINESVREKLQMEAAWLQAQIQPHFLFNALNTIMALSEIDIERMQKILDAFSHLLRRKFQFKNLNEFTTIREEVTLIETYLLIEKTRFEDRLSVEWKMDDVLDIKIPSLTIQPLVENAIHHGIMKKEQGGTLAIKILKEEENVKIIVQDTGVGIEEGVVKRLLEKSVLEDNQGVGLINTNLRLKRHFGEGLQIQSTPNIGTKITFRIPIQKESRM